MRHLYFSTILVIIVAVFFASGVGCKKSNNSIAPVTDTNANTYKDTVHDFKINGNLFAGNPIEFQVTSKDTTELWDFGDGTVVFWLCGSKNGLVKHTYKNSGVYTVKLISNGDSTHPVVKKITIDPSYRILYSGRQVAGEAMTFHYTTFLLLPVATYLWDFGDGSTSTDSIPTHVYLHSGHFQVHLIVNNDTSQIDSLSGGLTIHDDPYYTNKIAKVRLLSGTVREHHVGTSFDNTNTVINSAYEISYVSESAIFFYGDQFNYAYTDALSGGLVFQNYFPGHQSNITYFITNDSISLYYYGVHRVISPSLIIENEMNLHSP